MPPIARPSTRTDEENVANAVAQRCMYNGHKRLHGQKFLTLVTPDGMNVHIFGPWTGRNHDTTVYKHSKLEETIRQDPRFGDVLIYGDVIHSPIGGALRTMSRQDRQGNKSMSESRFSVEWSYGQIGKMPVSSRDTFNQLHYRLQAW